MSQVISCLTAIIICWKQTRPKFMQKTRNIYKYQLFFVFLKLLGQIEMLIQTTTAYHTAFRTILCQFWGNILQPSGDKYHRLSKILRLFTFEGENLGWLPKPYFRARILPSQKQYIQRYLESIKTKEIHVTLIDNFTSWLAFHYRRYSKHQF